MIGSKPLTDVEVANILSHSRDSRHRCLIIVGIRTGFRISELLSLKVEDCTQYGRITDSITVKRCNTKGKRNSRSVVLHKEAKEALIAMGVLTMAPGEFLFPFCRMTAHRVIKRAMAKSQITGKVSTHSMRKTFAKRVYEALDHDLINTQRALGHKSISSTVSYLSFNQDSVNKAILEE